MATARSGPSVTGAPSRFHARKPASKAAASPPCWQETVLELQHRAGNAAVVGLLGRRPAAPEAVQRMIWTYRSDHRWEKERKDPLPAHGPDPNFSDNPPNRPHKPRPYEVGESYDDAAAVPTLFHGSNAQTRGTPNRMVGYGEISAAEDELFRAGLAIAKLKLTRSIAAVEAAEFATRSGPPPAHVAHVLEVAFNVSPSLARPELNNLLTNLVAGLRRLLEGMSAELLLISSERMRAYGGLVDQLPDCSGWVPRGITEGGGRATPAAGASDLRAVSGEIHMARGKLQSPSFVADTVIHEGAHKFLGAWDYSYVGVQGSVGRGLHAKAQQLMADDSSLTAGAARGKAKKQSGDRAYAELVKGIVSRALEPKFPLSARGRAAAPGDGKDLVAARDAWGVVREWGLPATTPRNWAQVMYAITVLQSKPGLPEDAKNELLKVRADREAYLAEHGNDLGVKGHDVLFALPTGYLLKNADSWTELALTAG